MGAGARVDRGAAGCGLHPLFNQVPEAKTVKNRVHLDLRMLGLFPGSTIGPEAIGLLLGDDDSERPSEVSDLLALLEREHLIRQDPDVVLHDSVAAFARTIAAQEEPRSRQERAIVRLAEGYVELVRSAVAQGDPDWVEAERSAILAVAGLMGSWPTGLSDDCPGGAGRRAPWRSRLSRRGQRPLPPRDCRGRSRRARVSAIPGASVGDAGELPRGARAARAGLSPC